MNKMKKVLALLRHPLVVEVLIAVVLVLQEPHDHGGGRRTISPGCEDGVQRAGVLNAQHSAARSPLMPTSA